MADGRSQIRRRAGLRLWLSAGWLGAGACRAAGPVDRAARTPWRRICSLAVCRPFWVQGPSRAIGLAPTALAAMC
jgi:dipeptide transport system permease protein